MFGKIAFAVFVFIASAILATEILQKKIYFSLFTFLIGGTLSAVITLISLMQYLVSKTAPGEGFGLVIGAIMMFFFWLIASAFFGGILGIIAYNLIKHFRKQ